MELIFKSKRTKELNKKIIFQICKLKDYHWKFGFSNQLKWFDQNIRKNDIHNLCFMNKNLIGYTALRKGYFKYQEKEKKHFFLLFDTLILDSKYRKSKLGKIMMSFNNYIITKEKKPSFLLCKKELVNFYKKNQWKTLLGKNYITLHKTFNLSNNLIGMIYTTEILKKKIYIHVK